LENIILVGMMGSGKSSVGRVLQNLLEDDFGLVDSDLAIEKEEGFKIAEIFANKGEKYFRSLESKFLDEFKTSKCILSTGGGMPFFNENWQLLNNLGTTFFLFHPVHQLIGNIAKSKISRPLFNENDFRNLYEARLLIYKQSTFTIDCGNLHQTQIAKKIISLYNS
jgi:shikimate kinase